MNRTIRLIVTALLTLTMAMPAGAQELKLKPLKAKDLALDIEPKEKKAGQGPWGYTSADGKFIIKAVFEAADNFNRGHARVKYNGKYQILNLNEETGELSLSTPYDEMSDLINGSYRIVAKGGFYGTIKPDGTVIEEAEYDNMEENKRNGFNVRIVTKSGLYGALDDQGKVSVAPAYTTISELNEGVAIVIKNGKRGAISPSLELTVPTEYEWLEPSGARHLLAQKDGRMGVITYEGEIFIPIEFDEVTLSQSKRNYITKYAGKYGAVTASTGKVILTPQLNEAPELKQNNNLILQNDILYIISDHGASWWHMSSNLDITNTSGLSMNDTAQMNVIPLGTEMLMICKGDAPYFISKDKSVVWSANDEVRKWAEQPIHYNLKCETLERTGYLSAKNVYDKTVHLIQKLQISWPVAAEDPRVDVTLCQQTLLKNMSRIILGDTCSITFEDIDSLLNYATKHALDPQGLTNIVALNGEPKKLSTEEGGYEIKYTGKFMGDESSSDAAYNLYKSEDYIGAAHPNQRPIYIHFNKATGKNYTLDDRFSKTAHITMVNNLKRGSNIVYINADDSEIFESIKDSQIDDVNENFYQQDGTTYFYLHPVYSIRPIYVGLKFLGDIRPETTKTQKSATNEYTFTSYDLEYFGLHDHVKTMTITYANQATRQYLFNIDGQLETIDGYDPFIDRRDESPSAIYYKRDKLGRIIMPVADNNEGYQVTETDNHGNWTARKHRESSQTESRTITYY